MAARVKVFLLFPKRCLNVRGICSLCLYEPNKILFVRNGQLLSSHSTLFARGANDSANNDNKTRSDTVDADEKENEKSLPSASETVKHILSGMKAVSETATTTISLKLAKPEPRTRAAKIRAGIEGKKEPPLPKDPRLDKEIIKATRTVAESLSGDSSETESELLQKLREQAEQTEAARSGVDLSSLFIGMQIERNLEAKQAKRSPRRMKRRTEAEDVQHEQSVRAQLERERIRERRPVRASLSENMPQRVNLFEGKPLDIFPAQPSQSDQDDKDLTVEWSIWQTADNQELKNLVIHPPTNAFEEMALWTEQGKLWPFPIDNEMEIKLEENVGFHEHVFLDHLISDFPKRGPIRHFMELVVTGLSKNPHFTVEEKKEHINWFREYFKEKDEIIKDVMNM